MENGGKNKVFVYLLVAFFALFIGTGLFVSLGAKKDQQTPNNEAATTTAKEDVATLQQENLAIPTVAPTVGSLAITGEPSYTMVNTFNLTLEANSNGKNIVGYDTVVFYDPLSFEFVEAKSTLSDFKIYSYNRGNYLLLTAVKALDSTAPTVFGKESGNQPIATISFKPKKVGKFNFSLRSSAGKDITDMVTDQTEVLNPALKDLSVEIK